MMMITIIQMSTITVAWIQNAQKSITPNAITIHLTVNAATKKRLLQQHVFKMQIVPGTHQVIPSAGCLWLMENKKSGK